MGARSQPVGDTGRARVMLVEDSAVVRGMVRNWVDAMDGAEVVASADNGQVALNKIGAAKPDVIILDIEMPIMDGLTALPGLLRAAPGAKVLVASTLSRRNAEVSLKAMALGAADYIAKPSFQRDGNDARADFKNELIRKITGLAGINRASETAPPGSVAPGSGGTREPGKHQKWEPIPAATANFALRRASVAPVRALVVGSSTGGPAALTKLFTILKGHLDRVPVLITQHMPATFTALLGENLCRLTGLEGGEAKDCEPVVPGRIYVAPGGFHMRVVQDGAQARIALDKGPTVNHCRPAVDPLFESVSTIYRSGVLALILTGMGTDGAQGAIKVADAGGSVMAQDEKSSIVWGMPGAAMNAGACVGAFGLEELGKRVTVKLGARDKS